MMDENSIGRCMLILIQIIVGTPADAVLLCQCSGSEFSVGLVLVQLDDSLLAILKVGTMLQFMLDLCL